MNDSGSSQFNQARIEWAIRLRYSPMPELDMKWISSNLNAFRIGELRTVGKLWEVMFERDGELAVNADKRYSDLAGLEWQVVSDGSADGDKHAAALTYFYKHLTATHALDQDSAGGISQLLYQMASAHSYYYSAHEMLLRVDNAAAKEVTAEFRHTPIWFFEARRGYLGYLPHIFDAYGMPCLQGEWLTAVGSGWMRALSMAYAMKMFSLRDWSIFNARYATGILEGITDANKDDAAWEQAIETMRNLTNDGAALHSRGVEFKFLSQESARGQSAFEPMVERIDRLYAKCYRGVDLATGSRAATPSGGGGAGGKNPVGASVQSEESGIFLLRDACWATDYLNRRVDAPIVRYLFNQEPRAFIAITPPETDTSAEDLAAVQALVPMGLRIALKEAYKRFRFQIPSEGDPCLTAPAVATPVAPGGDDPDAPATPAAPPPPPLPELDAPSGADPSEQQTQTAQVKDETPIGAGARPGAMQTADERMPDPQVQAAGFWSAVGATARAILGPFGKRGQTPALAYAIPNAEDADKFDEAARKQFAAAVHADLAHAAGKINALLQIDDPEHFKSKADELNSAWQKITGNTLLAPSSADALAPVIATSFLEGATEKPTAEKS